jgi:hypothetical protein
MARFLHYLYGGQAKKKGAATPSSNPDSNNPIAEDNGK